MMMPWYSTAGQRHNHDAEGPLFSKFQTINESIQDLQREMKDLKAEVANMSKHTLDDPTNRVLKVHLWDDTDIPEHGFREKQIYSPEGFSTHHETTLVDSPYDADLVVWVTVRGNTEKEVPPRMEPNVVLLDYAEKRRGEEPDRIFQEGEVIYRFAYSGTKAMVNPYVNKDRDIVITNVLRTSYEHNTVRSKIVYWTASFVKDHGLENVSKIGTAGGGFSSSHFDPTYLEHLANSKIIVTCNPYRWEGDFRLWESLLSGAMVMVDRMAIPEFMPHPFIHKKHLVYYDPNNQTEFNELLDYYVKNEAEARKIGEAGYNFVLDHHMTSDR
ncbi:hypothetical protein THAOC_04878, partial [Thalassiosira oceanica]